MQRYNCRSKPIIGSNLATVAPKARRLLRALEKQTKRKPYIRSVYFDGQKVFVSNVWEHIKQKPIADQVRRLRLLPCAIELIAQTKQKPIQKLNPNKQSEILYRFFGQTKEKRLFCVHIKKSGRKQELEFMSAFPYKE